MRNQLFRIAALCLVPLASTAALASDSPSKPAQQTAIENGLIPIVTFEGEESQRPSLNQRRMELGVPAVSVAVLRDGNIAWVGAYGEDTDEQTLFQFASLSKPVAAAGIIALAFERGVSLDDDISGELTGLNLERLNPLGVPITLRGLLSHTNATTVSGFPGYAASDAIPTTAQVIEGGEITNTAPVEIRSKPDGKRRYSGGGYTIAQYWAEQVSGTSFEAVMRRLILDPLGMERSTFASAPPAQFARDNVAPGWRGNGAMLEGRWRIHPEQAAASLWSTPREYLLFVSSLMKALEGEHGLAISPEVAREMTTPIASSYGLGIGVADINGAIRLNHSGSNIGYKSNFMAYPATGDAVITVTNSDNGWRMVGDIGRTANVTYDWPTTALIVRTRMQANDEELAQYTGDFTAEGEDGVFTLKAQAPELVGSTPSGYTFRLVKTGEATFIDPQDAQEGTFITDDDGQVRITFGGTTYVRVAE